MRHPTFAITTLLAAATTVATPALAQDSVTTAATDPLRDTITIAVGAGIAPRYEGSRDSAFIPAVAARGVVRGVAFNTNGTELDTDLIPRTRPTGGKLLLGPVVHVTLNRSSLGRVRDPQIIALGKVKPAVELGGQIGYTQTGVITSAYDTLTLAVSYVHDVTGVHDGGIFTPSITYGTPLSTRAYVGFVASADHVDRRYAQTYFGVTPVQSAASRLVSYTPGSAWKDVALSGLANYSLTGDLRHGLSLFGIVSHAWLLGDIRRSPVVRQSGQWFAAAGLAYTF